MDLQTAIIFSIATVMTAIFIRQHSRKQNAQELDFTNRIIQATNLVLEENRMLTIEQAKQAAEEFDNYQNSHEIELKEWDEAFEKVDS